MLALPRPDRTPTTQAPAGPDHREGEHRLGRDHPGQVVGGHEGLGAGQVERMGRGPLVDHQVDPRAVDVDTRAEAGRGEGLQHLAGRPGREGHLVEGAAVGEVDAEGPVQDHRRPDQVAGLQHRRGHRGRRPVATSTWIPPARSRRTAARVAGWMRSSASERVPSRSVTTSWTAPLPRGQGPAWSEPTRSWSSGLAGAAAEGPLGQAPAVMQAAQGRRGPPVPAAHQLHGRRDQQHPDHGGVEHDGDGHAQPDLLDGQQLPGGEAEERPRSGRPPR